LERSAKEIHRLTVSDTLGQILANVQQVTVELREANIVMLINQLAELVAETNRLLNAVDRDMERGSKDFFVGLRRLRSTLKYLEETSRMINEDPSILIRGASLDEIPDDNLD